MSCTLIIEHINFSYWKVHLFDFNNYLISHYMTYHKNFISSQYWMFRLYQILHLYNTVLDIFIANLVTVSHYFLRNIFAVLIYLIKMQIYCLNHSR